MKKSLMLIAIISIFIASNAFAVFIVNDPQSIANQLLQLVDSGSIVTTTFNQLEEVYRQGEKMYKGFMSILEDKNGDTFEKVMKGLNIGSDALKASSKFTELHRGELQDATDVINATQNIYDLLVKVTEANKNSYIEFNPPGNNGFYEFGEKPINFSIAIPTNGEIKSAANSVKTMISVSNKKRNSTREKILNQIEENKKSLNELAANFEATEDIPTNLNYQNQVESIKMSNEVLEKELANLDAIDATLEKQEKETQKQIADMQMVRNFADAVVNEQKKLEIEKQNSAFLSDKVKKGTL